jgi:hypothetical protein
LFEAIAGGGLTGVGTDGIDNVLAFAEDDAPGTAGFFEGLSLAVGGRLATTRGALGFVDEIGSGGEAEGGAGGCC